VIPKAFITEWRARAPWSHDAWVEQDLVISRGLVEIFRDPDLASSLAFRGGTALHKLHLLPTARYSEDIDLVQIQPGPIGDVLNALRRVIDPWLGAPSRQLKEGRVNLVYRFDSEDAPPLKLRLKIEINSREHFTQLGLISVPFQVENRWFAGEADLTTFTIDELLGTKLRALYQRKKGRDLFDLWCALDRGQTDPAVLLACFERYMTEGGHRVSRAQFEANLHAKRSDPSFRGDIEPLLRPGTSWDIDLAMDTVLERVVTGLGGDAWKGSGESRGGADPAST
jgi:predicted nucleotidyltransferase component of viral defense system